MLSFVTVWHKLLWKKKKQKKNKKKTQLFATLASCQSFTDSRTVLLVKKRVCGSEQESGRLKD